jgi:hypothetical protein
VFVNPEEPEFKIDVVVVVVIGLPHLGPGAAM